LIKYLGYSLNKALETFERARGHEIENKKLKEELKKRYDSQ